MFKTRQLNYLIIFTLLLAIVACADFNKRSYQALGTMAVTYDTSLKAAADLYSRGLISEEAKTKIITAANAYQRSHNSAIDSFQEYLATPPEQQADKKQQFMTASKAAITAYGEFLRVLTDYGVYGEPVKPWF